VLYPDESGLRADIDAMNTDIYTAINNGSYKAGFSAQQEVYDRAFAAVEPARLQRRPLRCEW
jgi:putative glutathione S-transferase